MAEQTHGAPRKTPTVAIAEQDADGLVAGAAERGIPVQVVPVRSTDRPPDATPDVLVSSVRLGHGGVRTLLAGWPSVRWLHLMSAGADSARIPPVLERDVLVTRTRGQHGPAVAEFAMAQVLAGAKSLRLLLERQARKEWVDFDPDVLTERTLVIVGYGEIGHEVARRARAFDLHVIGVRRAPRTDDLADRVVGPEALHEVLGQADYVVLTAPSTPETRHMIGRAEIQAMAEHAYLVNVGRGSLIDEQALDDLLREGAIAGAFLDTFEKEPLPPSSPLWDNPRVVVTPHAAGLRGSTFTGARMEQFLDNVQRFANGEPLNNLVNMGLGY